MTMLYHLSWVIGQLVLGSGLVIRSGLENIPSQGGVILASNHQSYWDPPILGISLPRESFFLAKKELFRHKLLGWLISRLHTIPVSRDTPDPQAYKMAIKVLLSGKSLILFPEGTRNRGEEFLEPKLGVGLLALEAQVPIVPVYLENTRNLWKTLKNGKKILVKFGQPLSLSWLKGVSPDKSGYRQVAREVMGRIQNLKDSQCKVWK